MGQCKMRTERNSGGNKVFFLLLFLFLYFPFCNDLDIIFENILLYFPVSTNNNDGDCVCVCLSYVWVSIMHVEHSLSKTDLCVFVCLITGQFS